jgi:thiol-disulfide isomerase/thioredoxin
MTPLIAAPAAALPAARLELLKAGTPAPDFASNDLAGKAVRLADSKDKVVVLDFWATWCGPCMQSLPHTQEVARQYKDQGVVVLAVCTSDTRAKYEEWVKANQQKYADIAFTSDPNERGSATFEERVSKKLYGVSGIPTQYIIGRDGKVVAALVGYQAGDARLEAALAQAGIKVDPATAAKGEAQLRPTSRPAGR